ncbi:hypothetical protein ACF1CG_13020 [Streptomyces sp. NPDC014773]|uniref:hypothetical protein n=1 Tax=Streptomyces sp. NPDC014773 TaxID=3364908 RepID=UPI0036FC4795
MLQVVVLAIGVPMPIPVPVPELRGDGSLSAVSVVSAVNVVDGPTEAVLRIAGVRAPGRRMTAPVSPR